MIVGGDSESSPSHGEVRIEFDRALQMRYCGCVVKPGVSRFSQAEFLERVERRSRCGFQRCGKFLDGADRLSQFFAQSGCGAVERFQNLFFAVRFDLLAVESVASLDIHRVEGDDVVTAKAGDGALQHGFDAFAQADFVSDILRKALVGRTPHEAERTLDAGVRKNIQIRRLCELDGERLLERAVEHGIPGGVHEVGEEHAVFFRELRRLPRAEVNKRPRPPGP